MSPRTADADAGLEARVASAYMLRYEDANLHSIAHQRVAELAACACLEHDGMRSGTAEVIAYNEGYDDAIGRAVSGWQHSASHNALLSDPSYGRIGCAELVSDGVHWFACVLAKGALPPQPSPVVAAPLLPNTALPPPAP